MLNINSLPVISFANIFSYSVCCLFILLMVYCLDYYSFVVQSEFREPDSYSSIFLSEATGYSESFAFAYKFKIICPRFVKKCYSQFDRNCIESIDCLGSMVILTIVILLIQEDGISFYLCHLQFLLSAAYSFGGKDILPP